MSQTKLHIQFLHDLIFMMSVLGYCILTGAEIQIILFAFVCIQQSFEQKQMTHSELAVWHALLSQWKTSFHFFYMQAHNVVILSFILD